MYTPVAQRNTEIKKPTGGYVPVSKRTEVNTQVSSPINSKIDKYQAEQAVYDRAAEKANSPFGIFKETFSPPGLGKGVVQTIKNINEIRKHPIDSLRNAELKFIAEGVPSITSGKPAPTDILDALAQGRTRLKDKYTNFNNTLRKGTPEEQAEIAFNNVMAFATPSGSFKGKGPGNVFIKSKLLPAEEKLALGEGKVKSKIPLSGKETPQELMALAERDAASKHLPNLPKIQMSDEGIPLARKNVPFVPKSISSQKINPRLPKIDTTTGEGRSLEQTILQGEEYTPSIKNPLPPTDDVSLPSILPRSKTPVDKKVNIVDTFLRTPAPVMEKIGLGEEEKMLREGADKAKVELKKNIDKITNWSKEAPGQEANENIFDYLNGKAIDLPPNQKKVALEIRSWMKEWAERLGLPKDKQIDYYITHIFDKDTAVGDFPEDLAKMISGKIPGEVYDPFLLERIGKEGFKRDTWAALDAYVKRGTRKVHMDPALEAIKAKTGSSLATSKLEKSQFQYVQKYIDNINMRPSDFDTGFNNLLASLLETKVGRFLTKGKLGPRPYTTSLRGLRRATFRGMLGGNLTSALRNISQGVNTYSILGEKYTFIGYRDLYKIRPGSKSQSVNELVDEGIFDGGFIQDRVLSSFKKKIETFDKGLFYLFDTAEHINRGAAYFGAKAKGLAEGMSEREARDYAKNMVRQTQFLYDTVDTPVGLASDTIKTLTQFGTFSIKQSEFLINLAKDKNYAGLIRYALAGLAFTYTVGKAFDMKPEELVPFYGSFKRGYLPFGNPPSLKFPAAIVSSVLDMPDKYGNQRNIDKKLENIGNSAIGLIPGGIQLKKIFSTPKEEKGGTKTGLPKLPKLPKIK